MLINSIDELSKISMIKRYDRTDKGYRTTHIKKFCKLKGHPQADKYGNVLQKVLLVEYLLERNLKEHEKIQVIGTAQLNDYSKLKHATKLKVNIGNPINSMSSKPIVILFDENGKRNYYFYKTGCGSTLCNHFLEFEIYDKINNKIIDVYQNMPIDELENYINNPNYFIKSKGSTLLVPQ